MANRQHPTYRRALYYALWCIVFGVVIPLSACTSDIQLNAASPQTQSLTLHVGKISGGWGGEEAVRKAVIGALMGAGYRVVEQASVADVEVKVETAATQEQSILQIQIGNERKLNYKVLVTMAMVAGAEVIDQVKGDFSTKGTDVDEGTIKELVNRVTERGKLASYATTGLTKKKQEQAKLAAQEATKQREKEDAERRKKQKAEEAAKEQLEQTRRRIDERAWLDADVETCRTPRQLKDCDRLQKYLNANPQSYHADEARGILAQARPKLDVLQKDEEEWQTSGAEDCRRQRTKSNCSGVTVYLTKFPNGIHVSEANTLVEGL